ncbi:MAG: DUF2207 domain-containing protein, partial [Bacteroidetes bacterium]
MQRLITFLFALFLVFIAEGQEYERIKHYHSDIYVQKDCKVLIKEKIKVYANGVQIKRGIFRDIPLSYQYKGGNYHVDFDLISLTRDGKPESYHTEYLSNGIRIYAGSEDVFLESGDYEYEITYVVDHVLKYLQDFDELYWNINGNGWQFSIDSLTADVYYPEGAEYVQSIAYTGSYGEAGTDYESWEFEGGVHYSSTRILSGGENMTVAVAWSKGALAYPTAWDNFLHWIKTYILLVVGGLGILFSLIVNLLVWWRHGRDPKPGTIIPLFYPPTGFSPAECIYLKRAGKKSDEMFGSNLISLAVKGYISIDSNKEKGFGGKKVYTITKDDSRKKKELTEIEEQFLNKLMGSKDLLVIKEGKYNAKVASARTYLDTKIDQKQKEVYFKRNRHLSARTYIVPVITGILQALALWQLGGHPAFAFGPVFIQIVISFLFIRLLEQPT